MDEDMKRRLRMDARMDGAAAIVASIGRKISVSEMELICLANFAEIGLMSVFSNIDGEAGDSAEAELDQHIERVRRTFARGGEDNGLPRLSQSTAALLRGKFSKYIA